jgi:hypothetical protein
MKISILAALIALTAPALAQAPADHEQHHPGETAAPQAQSTSPAQPQAAPAQPGMPMGQMMQSMPEQCRTMMQNMPQGCMGMMQQMMQGQRMQQGRGMQTSPSQGSSGHSAAMGGPGRGMMGRLSPDDVSAFVDAHIAALRAGLKLSAEQERLWSSVEDAMRGLARLHLTHMQAMRQSPGTMADDPVGLLRGMAGRMSQGADAVRKLADAAAPLYATLDDAQKRRLQVLVRMGSGSMMSLGGRGMMRGWTGDQADDDQDDR